MRSTIAGVVVLAAHAAAAAVVPDARSWARGGADVLERADLSPGAARSDTWAADAWRVDAEAAIDAVALRFARGDRGWASAAAIEQWRSPIHAETTARVVLRRIDRWGRGGIGVDARMLRFSSDRIGWGGTLRAGVGTRQASFDVAALLEWPIPVETSPVVRVAVAREIATGCSVRLQLDDAPDLGTGAHVAIECSAARATWILGYDTVAEAPSVGFALGERRWCVAWGARAHPFLGWSHVWTCEYRR